MQFLSPSTAALLLGSLSFAAAMPSNLEARQGTSGLLTVYTCQSDQACDINYFRGDATSGCTNAMLGIYGQYVEVCADGSQQLEQANSTNSFKGFISDGLNGWSSPSGRIRLNVDIVEPPIVDNECKHKGLNIAFNGNTKCYKPLDAPGSSIAPNDAQTKACKDMGFQYAGNTDIWFNLGKNLC